jgi:hypothetical protein
MHVCMPLERGAGVLHQLLGCKLYTHPQCFVLAGAHVHTTWPLQQQINL